MTKLKYDLERKRPSLWKRPILGNSFGMHLKDNFPGKFTASFESTVEKCFIRSTWLGSSTVNVSKNKLQTKVDSMTR